jgi:hypothetical protein
MAAAVFTAAAFMAALAEAVFAAAVGAVAAGAEAGAAVGAEAGAAVGAGAVVAGIAAGVGDWRLARSSARPLLILIMATGMDIHTRITAQATVTAADPVAG